MKKDVDGLLTPLHGIISFNPQPAVHNGDVECRWGKGLVAHLVPILKILPPLCRIPYDGRAAPIHFQ